MMPTQSPLHFPRHCPLQPGSPWLEPAASLSPSVRPPLSLGSLPRCFHRWCYNSNTFLESFQVSDRIALLDIRHHLLAATTSSSFLLRAFVSLVAKLSTIVATSLKSSSK